MSKFTQYILEETHISSLDDIKGIPDKAAEVIQALVKYMDDKGMKIKPLPKLKVLDDEVESKKLLGNTGNYDHDNHVITIYTKGRLPEDYIRSFCHEMVHHIQNMEGRLQHSPTQNVNKDPALEQLEAEANRRGTMIFRAWKDEQLGRE